jgi:6-phosphofructokinase 1
MRTLLVVSGGDAPGVNAALYHYTRVAALNGDEVFGAIGAFEGLLQEQLRPLSPQELDPVVGQGGSYLPSSREPVLKEASHRERLKGVLKRHGIDNLVLFGGDGTLISLASIIQSVNIACLGIPATIDNDVPGSELTLGFASACTLAQQLIDGLRATARALPGRAFAVEVLGGNTGFLALDIAYAAGADAVLIPEYAYDLRYAARRLQDAAKAYRYGLVILSEGIRDSQNFAQAMQAHGLHVRSSKLGHAQRGAPPVHQDRKLAADMALLAHRALKQGAQQGTVLVQQGEVRFLGTTVAALPRRLPERSLYEHVNGLPAARENTP